MAFQGRAFLQEVPVGNRPSKTLTLFSYQGGLDNISSQSTTGNECATNVLNMIYLEDGLIQKRYGTNPYDDKTYNGDVRYIDTFYCDEGDKLVVATANAVYVDGKKIQDVQGVIEGVSVANKYMFVDGHFLYSYEKVEDAWKVFKLKTPTNLEDELARDAKKGDKVIHVKDGSKFKPGCWIQIGKREIDKKGMQSETPPPQTVRVLSVSGNQITLGEEIKIDGIETTTTTSTEDNSENKMKSDESTGKDETIVRREKTSGTWDGDNVIKTVTDSKRISGTSNTTTTVIGTGVSVVYTKNKKKEEDDIEVQYHRLEFDHKAGTPIIIFPNSELYQYIGEWKDNGTEKWYEPCTHELRSAYYGVNVLPPKPTHICFTKNRVIISGGDEEGHIIYMSEVNNPYYFPVSTGLALPNDGTEINGLVSFHDSIVLSRKNDMHVVYGSSNNPDFGDLFALKRITTHTGCISSATMKVVHNYLFYLGADGIVYRMHTTNTDVRLLATTIVSKTVDLFKAPLSLTLDEMKQATSTFTNEHYYLSIGDKVLVYSYRFMAWTVFDRLGAKCMYAYNDEVIWGKGNKLMHFDKTTFLDEGVDFNCLWESKLFDLDAPINYKYFKYISLVFDTYEQFDSTAKLIFEIDYEDVKLNHVFKNAVSRWGKSIWGVDRFATRNISKSLPIYVGRRGRLVKVKVHNGNFVKHLVNTYDELAGILPETDSIAFVRDTKKHFKYVYNKEADLLEWQELGKDEVNQPIKLYNIEIEYSLRGRR